MYDYVIVGAGSAGCVLASRLTEDPATTVLLLEAGPRDSKQAVHIPAAFSKLFRTSLDWAYDTVPQPRLDNRRMYWPRGKMLGGSSSMNAMIYQRGSRYDFDSWAAQGNPGWAYADVLPYFKRAEHQERGASEFHGAEGPLNVADLRHVNPMSRAFVEAATQAGIPRTDDFNGPTEEGVSLFQVTQKRGARHSAADAYLRPALKRSNLHVVTGALAARVVVEGGRAVGVEYIQQGQRVEAAARREVLLCGGAINSPQLLMLSGIGPAEHLRSRGIAVVADLPGVGRNLQDHLAALVLYESPQPVSLLDAEKPGNVLAYFLRRTGPLTSNVAEAGSFFKTRPDLPAFDLEVIFGPVYFHNHGFTTPPCHAFSLGPVLLTPESRGAITLRSADPADPPAIDPNYLAPGTTDLARLVEGIRLSRTIAQQPALAPFRGPERIPGAAAQADEEIAASIRANAETLYHPAGTCRMGGDPEAVVDAALRVRGVGGLRVVDASIMPTVIRGHTNAATIMIAEKAADLIKRDGQPAAAGVTTGTGKAAGMGKATGAS